MKDCVQYLRECGIDCPIYCGFTLAINGATEEEVNELFAMAETAVERLGRNGRIFRIFS